MFIFLPSKEFPLLMVRYALKVVKARMKGNHGSTSLSCKAEIISWISLSPLWSFIPSTGINVFQSNRALAITQPRPQGLLLFQNGGRRNPGQGCQGGSKSSLEFRHVNTMKCLRFVWITFSDCRKQTGPPDAGNNLRKSRFIMCHVTKYSTICGVFQQSWPGVSPTAYFERGEGPGDEVGQYVNPPLLCLIVTTAFPGFTFIVRASKFRYLFFCLVFRETWSAQRDSF